jgi:hypothetical protein
LAERRTLNYWARGAICIQLVSISENLGGIQAEVVKKQYKKIFTNFLPKIKDQRNEISHSYEHTLTSSDLDWVAVWQLVEDMAKLEDEINFRLRRRQSF